MNDLKLVQVIGQDQLLSLACRIRSDYPESVTVYNQLVAHSRGHLLRDTYYTLSSPMDTHIVVAISLKKPQMLSFYCRKEEVDLLIEALKLSQIVDWQMCLLQHLPDYMIRPMGSLFEEYGQPCYKLGRHYTFTCQLQHHQEKEPLRCGAGLRVCHLGKAGIRHMLETSTYNKNTPLEEMLSVAQYLPNAGVYEDRDVKEETTIDLAKLPHAGDEEKPLAWISSAFDGGLGMLMTEEGHRGRGLATLVTQVTARLQVKQGYVPHAFVDYENFASEKFFRKLCGWECTHNATWMWTEKYEKRGSNESSSELEVKE